MSQTQEYDLPAVKIPGARWNWKVEAKGARGKQQTSRSPVASLKAVYRFTPEYSGVYTFSIPVKFTGRYEVSADQVGAGGREAVVEIAVLTSVSNRGKTLKSRRSLFKKRVTKGSSSGPFNHTHAYSREVDLWVGTKPEQTLHREVVLTLTVELYAYAKWHKSHARLEFVKPGSTGIVFGTGVVVLKTAKPRKGEQAPRKK